MKKSVLTRGYAIFLRCLCQARQRAGLTQTELAQRLGQMARTVARLKLALQEWLGVHRGADEVAWCLWLRDARARLLKIYPVGADMKRNLLDQTTRFSLDPTRGN